MTLCCVSTSGQLKAFYASKGISEDADKIDCLIREMNIIGMRCEGEESQAEMLAGLEEQAMLGYWKDFS